MAVMGGSVARRYARALFGIGVDAGKFEAARATSWASWRRSGTSRDELRQALENPVFKPAKKRAVLENILPRVAPTPEVQRFVLLLLDAAASCCCPRSRAPTSELADAQLGRVRAEVTSAQPLDAGDARSRAPRRSSSAPARRSSSRPTVDPDLIGGVVARVGDLVLDGSVRTQLADLRDQAPQLDEATDEGTRHGNPRRRNQPDHPQADRGLRQEGRGHRDRHRARRPATASRASTASTARWPASCSSSATAASSGMVLNLEEDNVGVALLGNFEAIREGDTVKRTGSIAAGAGRRGAARPRGQRARRADRRQGPARRHGVAARSRSRRPASSRASRCTSRCRPASRPSTR